MKISFLTFLICLVGIGNVSAQVVNQDVHFDFYQSVSNNDFQNNFSGGLGLVQSTIGGITGGCLSTPDSINWGNDNAYYCSRYKPAAGDTTVTSICFKYDSTTVNLPSFQRATAIFLVPYTDFNHYVIAAVEGNKKISILSYGWSNNPYPLLTLHHNHWYRFQVKALFKPLTNQMYVKAEVLDIGLSGTLTPVSVNSSSGTFTDNVLATDTAVQVSIVGTRYGGAAYLDDFHFHGGKGMSNCVTITGLNESCALDVFSVDPNPVKDVLHIKAKIKLTSENMVSVYAMDGRNVLTQKLLNVEQDVDVSQLKNGIYFVRVDSDTGPLVAKIIVSR